MKRLSFLMITTSVFISFCWGCKEKPAPRTAETPRFPVATVRVAKLPYHPEILSVGRVKPSRKIDIVSRIPGVIEARCFVEGSFVRQGEVLYKMERDTYLLDCARAEAAVAAAAAKLQNAFLEYERSAELERSEIAAPKQFDLARAEFYSAQAQWRASKAELRQAELNLSYTEICAPFDGIVGMTRYDAGNFIASPAEVLTTLNAIDPVRVEFHLSDRYLTESFRQTIQEKGFSAFPVSLLNELKQPIISAGQLKFQANAIDPESASLLMQSEFSNSDHLLFPGQFVYHKLQMPEMKTALVLPAAAIRFEQDQCFVLRVSPENRLEFQSVKIAPELLEGGVFSVLEGVQEGDLIALPGNPLLRNGSLVVVEPTDEPPQKQDISGVRHP